MNIIKANFLKPQRPPTARDCDRRGLCQFPLPCQLPSLPQPECCCSPDPTGCRQFNCCCTKYNTGNPPAMPDLICVDKRGRPYAIETKTKNINHLRAKAENTQRCWGISEFYVVFEEKPHGKALEKIRSLKLVPVVCSS